MIGKYMNGYTGGYVPAPWERFFASTRPYQDSPPLTFYESFHGPHFPAFSDPADADRFADLEAPRVPSWDASDADDPQYVKDQAPSRPRKPGPRTRSTARRHAPYSPYAGPSWTS